MKKMKLLIPAVAVLGLGIAASTTATVAWFQANKEVLHTLTPETGSISATLTDLSVGRFTFVLDDLTSSDAEIDLTDQYGKSYVYIDSDHYQEVTPADPTAEWSGLTWKINYAGPSNTAAKIQVEWDSFVAATGHSTATVEAVSDEASDHVVRFGNTGATAAQCASGAYTLKSSLALNSLSWSSVSVTNPVSPATDYTAQLNITDELTKAAFATALTGKGSNEGTLAAYTGTNSFTVRTVLA